MNFVLDNVSTFKILDKTTRSAILKSEIPSEMVVNNLNEHKVPVAELKVGLKIEVRDKIYQNILNDPYIKDNFKLGIKRLNRWWYSIYFGEKEK